MTEPVGRVSRGAGTPGRCSQPMSAAAVTPRPTAPAEVIRRRRESRLIDRSSCSLAGGMSFFRRGASGQVQLHSRIATRAVVRRIRPANDRADRPAPTDEERSRVALWKHERAIGGGADEVEICDRTREVGHRTAHDDQLVDHPVQQYEVNLSAPDRATSLRAAGDHGQRVEPGGSGDRGGHLGRAADHAGVRDGTDAPRQRATRLRNNVPIEDSGCVVGVPISSRRSYITFMGVWSP